MLLGRAIQVASALLVASVLPAWADTVAGRAEVIDGDTIAIEGVETRIRLYGIDAPEGKQTCLDAASDRYLCGSRAADALASLIGRNGRVTCEEQDRDRYGRIVAVCRVNGVDLNGELVVQGWALSTGTTAMGGTPTKRRRPGKPHGVCGRASSTSPGSGVAESGQAPSR